MGVKNWKPFAIVKRKDIHLDSSSAQLYANFLKAFDGLSDLVGDDNNEISNNFNLLEEIIGRFLEAFLRKIDLRSLVQSEVIDKNLIQDPSFKKIVEVTVNKKASIQLTQGYMNLILEE